MTSNKKDRHESRVLAIKAMFEYIVRNESVEPKILLQDLFEMEEKSEDDFAESLIMMAIENIKKIKLVIRAFASEFAFEKIAPINRAILILGIAELKYFDTPPIVVINEYIEIAKEYGEERSSSFVNGVLDSFRKGIGKERLEDEEKVEKVENESEKN